LTDISILKVLLWIEEKVMIYKNAIHRSRKYLEVCQRDSTVANIWVESECAVTNPQHKLLPPRIFNQELKVLIPNGILVTSRVGSLFVAFAFNDLISQCKNAIRVAPPCESTYG
jgi:hypothetical protein